MTEGRAARPQAEQLTRRAARVHLERAFADARTLYGDEVLDRLIQQGAPTELVALIRRRVRPEVRFAGSDALQRHLRGLPR